MDLPHPPPHPASPDAPACPDIPQFRRLRYSYGQLLGVADFQAEQDFHRDKARLHNRCLHGYGVICGLLVRPAETELRCEPEGTEEARQLRIKLATLQQERASTTGDALVRLDGEIAALQEGARALPDPDCYPRPPTRLILECGIGLDCRGNELVVRHRHAFDPWPLLSAAERERAGHEPVTLFISLCFCEQGIDPIRPILNDPCGTVATCAFGKVRETVQITVSLSPPDEDRRCETCCTACAECCLLLARVDGYRHHHALEEGAVHNEVRRRLPTATRPPTVITGINWVHGARYSKAQGEQLLGTYDEARGIEIQFSRPVHASSLRRGVVELWRLEGGGGRSGYLSEIRGRFVDLPESGTVNAFRYRQADGEDLDGGDRILIQVRCAFILDECCMPVDGAHVGGRVPPLPDAVFPDNYHAPTDCLLPPWGYGPWTSGNGTPGSGFESWFVVAQHDAKPGGYRQAKETDR
jgi:hypothetical protein